MDCFLRCCIFKTTRLKIFKMIRAHKFEQTAIVIQLDSSEFTDESPTFTNEHQRFPVPQNNCLSRKKTQEKPVDLPQQSHLLQCMNCNESRYVRRRTTSHERRLMKVRTRLEELKGSTHWLRCGADNNRPLQNREQMQQKTWYDRRNSTQQRGTVKQHSYLALQGRSSINVVL